MRIVSGTCGGRLINPPKNFRARPTTDFAKENIFNVISSHFDIEQLTVLDLFSGTGSISYEFASRGAVSVTSVEMDSVHQQFIVNTIEKLKLGTIRPMRMNAFVFLKSCKISYDIIFADPPYDLDGTDVIPDKVFEKGMLNPSGWLIFEHSKAKDFSNHHNFIQKRVYGSVNFSIFANK